MTTFRLTLVKENIKKPTQQVLNAADVYQVMKFLENEDREKFYVLHLDTKSRILAMELVSIGALTASLVHPREVFKAAIMNNSFAIICVHNHPSGDIAPSPEDKAINERLTSAGNILGIAVHDHVIIGHGGFGRVITSDEETAARALQLRIEKSKKRKTPRRKMNAA